MNFRTLLLIPLLFMSPDFGGGGFNPGNARDVSDALSRALGGDSNGGALLSALRASSGLGGAGNMALSPGEGQSLDVNGIMRLVDQRVARALSGIRGIGVAMPVRSSSQDIDNASETLTHPGTISTTKAK